MSADNSIDNPAILEKGENIDSHTKLAEEVYGAAALTGEVDKFSSIGLRLRTWVRKLGAEEGGIERVPEELRTDQHPRGNYSACDIPINLRSVLPLLIWKCLYHHIGAGCPRTHNLFPWSR